MRIGMKEIRKLDENDAKLVSDLKVIWMECFQETEDSWEFYYKNRFRYENTCVYIREEKVVGMLTMLPATLLLREQEKKLYYIYAVATLPDFQKQGVASDLLTFAKDVADKEEALLCLVPASAKLFSYYEKKGFISSFYRKKIEYDESWLKRTRSNKCQLCESEYLYKQMQLDFIEPETYKRLRDGAFQKSGYVKWDLEAVSYALKENNHYNGFTIKLTIKQKEYIIMAAISDKKLIIRETTLDSSYLSDIVYWLCQEKGCKYAVAYVPAYFLEGEVLPFGMLSEPISIENAYLNLALDG